VRNGVKKLGKHSPSLDIQLRKSANFENQFF